MSARPLGTHYGGRALRSGAGVSGGAVWVEPAVLLGLALAVVALFALTLTVVLDAAVPSASVPVVRVVEGTLAARTDSAAPYAARVEMRIKPQRP